jgi:phytoene dehydrogenase-like protein
MPKHPLTFMRFGSKALWPATWFARGCFREERTRALFGGCAAHSVLPLNAPFTAALGLIFTIAGHVDEWPVAAGGSRAISDALASLLRSLGGEIQTGVRIKSVDELPPARVFLFDTGPDQLATIAEPVLPERYVRRLRRYRFGPGVFKLDWALEEPIPWRDKNCLLASTVHLGGRMAEIAAAEAALSRGEHPTRPFVLLCQQSQFDDSRAPTGKQTGYAYCHVPAGSNVDLTEAIENQVERFAPGFKDTIRARHAMHCADFERYNPNFVGGAITGGSADITQLMTRPVARLDPYTTPNRRVFLCSASTPPGGGVHGMCGYNAARSALRQLDKIAPGSLRA